LPLATRHSPLLIDLVAAHLGAKIQLARSDG
jgi:hypothetical protein